MDKVYVALDFETADYKADSACAIGLAKIIKGEIVDHYYSLIMPPRKHIVFTYIHGLTWLDLQDAPSFTEIYADLTKFWSDADYLVAHNASFDRNVLQKTCEANDLKEPNIPFLCTCIAARRNLALKSNSLDNVCKHFDIHFEHHHAGEDATACGKVLINLLNMNAKLT